MLTFDLREVVHGIVWSPIMPSRPTEERAEGVPFPSHLRVSDAVTSNPTLEIINLNLVRLPSDMDGKVTDLVPPVLSDIGRQPL